MTYPRYFIIRIRLRRWQVAFVEDDEADEAEDEAEAGGHEEEGELDHLRDEQPLPVDVGVADEERADPDGDNGQHADEDGGEEGAEPGLQVVACAADRARQGQIERAVLRSRGYGGAGEVANDAPEDQAVEGAVEFDGHQRRVAGDVLHLRSQNAGQDAGRNVGIKVEFRYGGVDQANDDGQQDGVKSPVGHRQFSVGEQI